VNYFRTRYSDITRQEPEQLDKSVGIPVHLNSTYDLDHSSSCFGFILNLQLVHQTVQQDLLRYQNTKCDNCVCVLWGESTYCFTYKLLKEDIKITDKPLMLVTFTATPDYGATRISMYTVEVKCNSLECLIMTFIYRVVAGGRGVGVGHPVQ